MNITYRNQPVQNPILRAAALLAAVGGSILMVAALILLAPVLVPLHFALVRLGRRGFVTYSGRAMNITVSVAAFRR